MRSSRAGVCRNCAGGAGAALADQPLAGARCVFWWCPCCGAGWKGRRRSPARRSRGDGRL